MKKLFLIAIIGLFLVSLVAAQDSTEANPGFEYEQKAVLGAQAVQNEVVEHCYQADESYALYHNGLWWAWVAPVAREWSGLTPDPSLIGDGWRWVSGEEEWALGPEASTFQSLDRCAARTFFPAAAHCDWSDPYYTDGSHPNGYLTYYLDGSVAELWVVHDDCEVPPRNDVPEFGLIGAGALILGAVIFIFVRRK